MAAAFPGELLDTLQRFRFIKLYQKKRAYVLTEAGNQLLDEHLDDLPTKRRPKYREAEYQRRTRVSRFAVTAYRAGLSVFQTELSALDETGACFLTPQSRTPDSNPWGSARIAAIAHLGDMACAVHYVSPGIGKITLADEMNAFLNNIAHLENVSPSIIYTGRSYEEIVSVITERSDGSDAKLLSYGDAFLHVPFPVFLVPCTETGAQQLHMMMLPNYRAHMTSLALGTTKTPPPEEHPEWDAIYNGVPFVMAADMDLHRIDAAAESAKADGYEPICLIALKGQEKVLRKRYKATGLAQKVFTFSRERPEVISAIALYTPPDRPFETTKGEVIHVPPIQTKRKALGTHQKSARKLDNPSQE